MRMHPSAHPLYNTWKKMRDRCQNPRATQYPYYGGRGVTVCDRWNDFMAFAADMGPRPDGHTLDRKDSSGDYMPTNCRWASRAEQTLNRDATRMVLLNGETMCAKHAASRIGVDKKTLYRALNGDSRICS